MESSAWRVITFPDTTQILLCLCCNNLSEDPNNIKHHYCPKCQRWLDDYMVQVVYPSPYKETPHA
jgi:hypothetical protein